MSQGVASTEVQRATVCVVTTVHPLFDTRVFHRECMTLSASGYRVVLIALETAGTIEGPVESVRLPRPRTRFVRWLIVLPLVLFVALKQRAAIYHLHDPELLPMGILLKLLGRRVVYDIHEDVPRQVLSKEWIFEPLRASVAKLYRKLEQFAVHRFDGTIVATEGIAARVGLERAVIVRNYPVLSLFSQEGIRDLGSDFIAIYVGSLSRDRGLSEMVEAVRCVEPEQRTRLHLVGPFQSFELRRQVLRSIEGSPTEWLGVLPPEEVYEHLKRSHVGLVCLHPVPRFLEALPVKLFEYMAAGLPVISSNFPLWKEIVEGNRCGLTVNPLNPQEIARAIQYLLAHPEEAKRMGENGRRAVLENFNWENEGKKLLALYEELLGETR